MAHESESPPDAPTVSPAEAAAVRSILCDAIPALRAQLVEASAGDRLLIVVSLAPGRIGPLCVIGNAPQPELASALQWVAEQMLAGHRSHVASLDH